MSKQVIDQWSGSADDQPKYRARLSQYSSSHSFEYSQTQVSSGGGIPITWIFLILVLEYKWWSNSDRFSLILHRHHITSCHCSINIFTKYCILNASICTSTFSMSQVILKDTLQGCHWLISHSCFLIFLSSHHSHSLSCWRSC